VKKDLKRLAVHSGHSFSSEHLNIGQLHREPQLPGGIGRL
jgi:hypothetical protein